MYRLATMKLTDEQKSWLESEKVKTGQSYAAIIRILINEQMRKKK